MISDYNKQLFFIFLFRLFWVQTAPDETSARNSRRCRDLRLEIPAHAYIVDIT